MTPQESTSKIYSFFRLLDNDGYRIVIPIIQRDYAQGRRNERTDEVRSDFLKELHKYMLDTGHSHDLDFVYGTSQASSAGTKFYPLDGQQRLTTLFLLHWYLAQRCHGSEAAATTARMMRTVRNGLVESDFTYLTRVSSTDFCNELVKLFDKPLDFENLLATEVMKGKNVVEVPSIEATIKDMNWYSPFWDNDPTIQSMLVMLDAIHKEFGGDDHEALLRGLIDPDTPTVTFIFKDLDEYKLTDDLYIKMNSRGKPLTSFENFKAKLEQYISGVQDDPIFARLAESIAEAFNAKKSTIQNVKQYFSFNIDTRWTNLFWTYARRELSEMDTRQHELALEKHLDSKIANFIRVIFTAEYPATAREAGRSVKIPGLLHDESREEISFNQYKERGVLSPRAIKYLIDALDALSGSDDGVPTLLPDFHDYDEAGIYEKVFLLQSPEQKSVKKLEFVDRVRFHAYLRFIIAYGKDKIDDLKEWMHFVYNITHTPNLNVPLDKENFGIYIVAINAIIEDMVAGGISSVTQLLATKAVDDDLNLPTAGYQIQEEKIKARLSLRANSRWRAAIAKYESHEYFTGQIGFLLDFAGIVDYFTQNGNCDWTPAVDDKFFETFTIYGDIASEIFAGGYGRRKYAEDALLERAMLCVYPKYVNLKGDNLLNSTQTGYHIRRDNSWKRALHIDEDSKYRSALRTLIDLVAKRDYAPIAHRLRSLLEDIIRANQPTNKNLAIIVNHPNVIRRAPFGFFSTHEGLMILHSGKMYGRGDVEVHTFDLWESTFLTDFLDGYGMEYQCTNWMRDGDCPHIEAKISTPGGATVTLSIFAQAGATPADPVSFYAWLNTFDLRLDPAARATLTAALAPLGFTPSTTPHEYRHDFPTPDYIKIKEEFYALLNELNDLFTE